MLGITEAGGPLAGFSEVDDEHERLLFLENFGDEQIVEFVG